MSPVKSANLTLRILLKHAVVQVIYEETNEIIYTMRIKGKSFRPKVFKAGKYTIIVGEPGSRKTKILKGVFALKPDRTQTLEVMF